MSEKIFEVADKTRRKIELTKERWAHIRLDHPNVEEKEIKETLKEAIKISEVNDNKAFYYKYFKRKKQKDKFLRVIVR